MIRLGKASESPERLISRDALPAVVVAPAPALARAPVAPAARSVLNCINSRSKSGSSRIRNLYSAAAVVGLEEVDSPPTLVLTLVLVLALHLSLVATEAPSVLFKLLLLLLMRWS